MRPHPNRLRRRACVALLLWSLLLATGCTRQSSPPDTEESTPPPFAGCTALTAPPAVVPTVAPTVRAGQPDIELAEIELPCFTGGEIVPIRALRGPAVINLWASWCPPCRRELPAFQRLSERTAGRLHVIGVNSGNLRTEAQSLAEDFGLTFPNLFDPDYQLRRALQRPFLPMTVFIDGEGDIRHIDTSGALDDATLADLIERHLGVVVPS